jgi:hypothetical protein
MDRKKKLIFSSLILIISALFFSIRAEPSISLNEMIASSLPPHPRWSVAEEGNCPAILSQKFTMLGKGEQVFAFESEDGKYVLKLFKMHRLMPSRTDYLCPYFAQKRVRKLNRVFTGYKTAYEDFREESGLVWIHLAKTNHLHQTITLFDENGKKYQIDADKTEFVIQEKAELIFDRIARLYKEGGSLEAEKAIASFYAFIQHRTDKGLMDRDKSVAYNYGFIGDRPIQIDLGSFHKRTHRKEHNEPRQLAQVQQRVEQWKAEQLACLCINKD